MAYIDPTYREQSGPDAEIARRQSDLLSKYFNQPWQSYTPAFRGFTGGGTVGNGPTAGYYKRLGSMCFGRVTHTLGSTTSFGTSALVVSLPFIPQAGVGGTFHYIDGQFVGVHASTGAIVFAALQLPGTGAAETWFAYPNGAPTGTATNISGGSSTPWSWAVGDSFEFNFTYEVAK